jgi:hypothetical protein
LLRLYLEELNNNPWRRGARIADGRPFLGLTSSKDNPSERRNDS